MPTEVKAAEPVELSAAEQEHLTVLEGLFSDPNSDAAVSVSASHWVLLTKLSPKLKKAGDGINGGKLVVASEVCSVLHPDKVRTPDPNADKPVKMPASKAPAN